MSDAFDQAKTQLASIVGMVAALNVDYDRLEELREERDGYDAGGFTSGPVLWAQENADDADELAELESAAGDCESADDARTRITDDALSVQVRSGWESSASEFTAWEYKIVLCTGGPHVEIRGDLDEYNNPMDAKLVYSDMGGRGTLELRGDELAAVLEYAGCYHFGE